MNPEFETNKSIQSTKDYSYEIITTEVTTADAERYRDVERFLELCRECPCYGRRWCCPPLESDILEKPGRYNNLILTGVKITPEVAGRPIGESAAIIADCRRLVEPGILDMESEKGGFAALFTGQCTLCGKLQCTRIKGEACRHPELVRPSLEALGYNVGALAEEFLGLKLQWSADGKIPDYLVIVAGLFI